MRNHWPDVPEHAELSEDRITADGDPSQVLTEADLGRLYGIGVGILHGDGRRLIYPRL